MPVYVTAAKRMTECRVLHEPRLYSVQILPSGKERTTNISELTDIGQTSLIFHGELERIR